MMVNNRETSKLHKITKKIWMTGGTVISGGDDSSWSGPKMTPSFPRYSGAKDSGASHGGRFGTGDELMEMDVGSQQVNKNMKIDQLLFSIKLDHCEIWI